MAVAPEPQLLACLTVLQRACIDARLLGYAGERDGLSAAQSQELADLMDAVHNIPDLVRRWESCDEELLREMLRAFDERWRSRGGVRLLAVWDAAVDPDTPPSV
jgi:hypothetical protein